MQVMHFYRDAAGDPRATSPASRELLARFLESDVQGSGEHAREILGAIDRVAEEGGSWRETGNAHTLTLSPEGAAIESELEDEEAASCRISLDELRAAVAGWLEFLERTEDH